IRGRWSAPFCGGTAGSDRRALGTTVWSRHKRDQRKRADNYFVLYCWSCRRRAWSVRLAGSRSATGTSASVNKSTGIFTQRRKDSEQRRKDQVLILLCGSAFSLCAFA